MRSGVKAIVGEKTCVLIQVAVPIIETVVITLVAGAGIAAVIIFVDAIHIVVTMLPIMGIGGEGWRWGQTPPPFCWIRNM
jgi:uncharacterized protein HemY